MKNEDLFLESESGFYYPFVTDDGSQVEVSLGYGEQTHPNTGEKFFHQGIDFICSHLPLYAVATGTCIGVGSDSTHENFVVLRYGLFEVKYGHVTNAMVRYGQPVSAGQPVAISGDFLHMGVRVNGEQIDPMVLIRILFGNIAQLTALGMKSYQPRLEFDIPAKTSFDKDQDDLIPMLLHYMPQFFQELAAGSYSLSSRTVPTLQDLFRQVQDGHYTYEAVPMMGNPLGLGPRSAPLVGQIQDVFLREFLHYMALRHNTYLPSWGDDEKKSLETWHSMTE